MYVIRKGSEKYQPKLRNKDKDTHTHTHTIHTDPAEVVFACVA